MPISREIIEQIKNRISIVDVVSEYTQIKQKGRRYFGLCPFHSDKDPSFSVDNDFGLFYCFGCHKGGDVFAFLMEIEKISFSESVEILAEKLGIKLHYNTQHDNESKQIRALEDFNERIAKLFNHFLYEEKFIKVLEYCKRRHISDNTIKEFKLGVCPGQRNWLFEFLIKKGYSKDFLKSSGLFSSRKIEYCIFSGRLIFPIVNHRGLTIGFGGRSVLDTDSGPKYINSPETLLFKKKDSLYGLYQSLDEIRKNKSVIIVEGYFDVLALHQSGIKNVVAPLGTAFTLEQAKLLKRYASCFYFLFDSDSAGLNATYKAGLISEKIEVDAFCIPLPNGDDPASMLEKKGEDGVYSYVISFLEKRKDIFKYILEKYSKNTILSTHTTKEAVIKKMFDYIAVVNSSIRRENLLQTLAEYVNVPIDVLKEDFFRSSKTDHNRNTTLSSFGSYVKVKKSREKNEFFLFKAICSHPEYFKEIRRLLTVDDISSDLLKTLYIIFEEAYRDSNLSISEILDKIDSEELKNFVLDAMFSDEFDNNTDALLVDAARKIKISSIEDEIGKIVLKLKNINNDADIKKLLEKQQELQEELIKLRGVK